MYLSYLKSLPQGGPANISSAAIAAGLGLSEIQVRKDLASVSDIGKPKIGYITDELISELESYLGYNNIKDAVVVGCGSLGHAILNYTGFGEYGINMAAGFDVDDSVFGETKAGKNILPMSKLASFCTCFGINIGILCVPESAAQTAYNLMVDAGIRFVLNLTPAHLNAPRNSEIKNVNIAAILAELANHQF